MSIVSEELSTKPRKEKEMLKKITCIVATVLLIAIAAVPSKGHEAGRIIPKSGLSEKGKNAFLRAEAQVKKQEKEIVAGQRHREGGDFFIILLCGGGVVLILR